MRDGIHAEEIGTHCPYCAPQCGMNLVAQFDRLAVAVRDFPTNKGALCRKGWTAAETLSTPDRLTTPLMRVRKNEPLRPVSRDVALSRVAESIRAIQASRTPVFKRCAVRVEKRPVAATARVASTEVSLLH